LSRPANQTRARDVRADLLSNATHLVLTKGYATTSIDAINSRAGLSKGTFYHYFRSKSELLDAVVAELTREGADSTRRAIENGEGGALVGILRFLDAARRWRLVGAPEAADVIRAVFRPENSLLRERMRDQSIKLTAPALISLLEAGNAEGVFRVDDPVATARVFLILAYGVSDDMLFEVMSSELPDDDLLESIVQRGRAFMRAVEALLGVAPKSLGEPDIELLAGMVRAFRSESVDEKPA